MHKDVLEKELTSTQKFILSMDTCQWWNAVEMQACRFYQILKQPHGGTPWDKDEQISAFVADRMFLIVAIFHAIENLEKMNMELSRKGDNSLQIILNDIEHVAPLKDIKNLRDMNIHKLDYLVEKGQKKEQFRTTISEGDRQHLTTAAWTHIDHDTNSVFLGNVNLGKLLDVFNKHSPFVRTKSREVYDEELFGSRK